MKHTVKPLSRLLVVLALVSACFAAGARAQNREEHFISARAGGVNFVSGDVSVRRADEKEWQKLSVKDDLKSGDAVRASGRVEVLLNPGSYLRAGDGAEFEMANDALDDLQLKLTRGGIVIEVTGYEGMEISTVVVTPQAHVRIVRGGLYRLNVLPSGATEVAVQSGRVFVGTPETRVKGGNVALVSAGGVEVAKFDKNNRDALDLWSRERGHELAKINDKLANSTTNAMLARTSFDSFFSAANRFDTFGLWLWSGQYSCYTFLPFSNGYRSPYGFGYGSSLNPFYNYQCASCRLVGARPGENGPQTYQPDRRFPSGPQGGVRPVVGSPVQSQSPAPRPTTIDRSDRIGGREMPSAPSARPVNN